MLVRILHQLVDIRADRGDGPGMKAAVDEAIEELAVLDAATADEPA
ncbi:MAG: hypothetical protein ABI614_08515 [Planctomycetota bacterium]